MQELRRADKRSDRKSDEKFFSIVIATYNCGRKIQDTLDSIFAQDRELFEVIVVDGASTDDTLDHIRKYEKDITLISEEDEGVYFAFNKGIDRSRGRYLYFIGAGDILRPDALEKVKDVLPSADIPALVYGKCFFLEQQVENGMEFSSRSFMRRNICHQGIFYHREVFDLIGRFDLQYMILSDWVFNFKCFLDERVTKKYIGDVIADYEGRGLSAMQRDEEFLKRFPSLLKEQFGVCSYLVHRYFPQKISLLTNYVASRNKLSRPIFQLIRPYLRKVRSVYRASVL